MKIISSQDVILAIAPGKRELGFAVFIRSDLIYHSVKSLRRRKSIRLRLKGIAEILERLYCEFSIKTIVIKALTQYQKLSPDLAKIVEEIKRASSQKGLETAEITLEQIKAVLCESKKSTEKKAFEALIAIYPELDRYWNRPNKWQNDYYAFLFSAVAAGLIYLKTRVREK